MCKPTNWPCTVNCCWVGGDAEGVAEGVAASRGRARVRMAVGVPTTTAVAVVGVTVMVVVGGRSAVAIVSCCVGCFGCGVCSVHTSTWPANVVPVTVAAAGGFVMLAMLGVVLANTTGAAGATGGGDVSVAATTLVTDLVDPVGLTVSLFIYCRGQGMMHTHTHCCWFLLITFSATYQLITQFISQT